MKCNASSIPGRRAFLKLAGLAALGTSLESLAGAAARPGALPAPTHSLCIRAAQVELAPGHAITTTTYDGQLPGPPLRTAVGQRVIVDVHNETSTAERVSWHGQDMALDEASLVPPHALRRMEFTPTRPGLYFYHSGRIAAADLQAGLYSGQAGALLVEPRNHPGRYDHEWIVVLKECEPFIRRTRRGCEVGYRSLTVNGRTLDPGNRLRVKAGHRVLLHVVNASATEPRTLALPGHSFEVTALNGCAVSSPARVTALHLNPAERVSALLDIVQPAGWVLRDRFDAMRNDYPVGCGQRGSAMAREPDATVELVLTRHDAARSGFSRWSINGTSFSSADPRPALRVQYGLRYRLRIRNTSDEVIPVHLQRHRLEVARASGSRMAGLSQDVVTIGAEGLLEVDFTADNPGPALFYCTRQLHRDFGLMALLDYAT